MIVKNLIIGKDNKGNILQCGDICLFEIKLQRPNTSEAKVERMIGMIVYDEDSFAYAFETLDDFAPMLLMYCAELGSVEKIYDIEEVKRIPIVNYNKWIEIYNHNLEK